MNNIDIIKEIIKEQSLIVGEQLAIDMAEASGVVKFNSGNLDDIYLTSDSTTVIQEVIKSFELIFGPASTQVCNKVLKRMQN